MGREIHFIYKEENYYIGELNFWRFYDEASEIEGEDFNDLLQKVKLDGKSIMELWDRIEIETIF
ncbi:hypothetical protein [Niallia sp. MER 6]|nr:hypothetical protein [Niallia sp. MER 6]MCM3034214.1 hypothetical protein [Niallia sp. MER 6]